MTSKPGIMNVAENFKSTQLQTKNNVSRGFATLNQLIAVGDFSDNNLNFEKLKQTSEQVESNGFIQTLQHHTNLLKF